MSFEALIDKVKQAEAALEAHERQAAGNAHQLLATWRAAWTPGRILLAGIGSGFAIGLLEPGKRFAGGRTALQMLTTVAGLFAGGSAQAAASKAEDAADAAAQAPGVSTADQDLAMHVAPPPRTNGATRDGTDPEALRRAGLL